MYRTLYTAVAGEPPDPHPWHFQWLSTTILHNELRELLGRLSGDVLDVGCGEKPYREWVQGARRYFGIDVYDGPHVDAVISPGQPWPIQDGEFDVVLCTQVLEHVRDLDFVAGEVSRVLRAGGLVIASVPFIYPEHGSPHDYRRFSQHGIEVLLSRELDIVQVALQGGVGSTLGAILLAWIEQTLTSSRLGTLLITLLLPLWVLFCAGVNVLAVTLDRLDRTGLFYGNVVAVAQKPPAF